MNKPADVQHAVHDLIKNRWSPRAFSPQPVEKEKLLSVLEAARWSASSANEQPWKFFVAEKSNSVLFDQISETLSDNNKRWASNAPVLIITAAKLFFEKTGKENRHAFHDVGLATSNLFIEAENQGLRSHPMAGFSVEKMATVLQLPPDFSPATVIALGYAGNPDDLPEDLKSREMLPRLRKPFEEIITFI